jgi:hypothetical protein
MDSMTRVDTIGDHLLQAKKNHRIDSSHPPATRAQLSLRETRLRVLRNVPDVVSGIATAAIVERDPARALVGQLLRSTRSAAVASVDVFEAILLREHHCSTRKSISTYAL